ncbi:hypothetical protein STANM309S_04622 [Streptomyces tanashiensis]
MAAAPALRQQRATRSTSAPHSSTAPGLGLKTPDGSTPVSTSTVARYVAKELGYSEDKINFKQAPSALSARTPRSSPRSSGLGVLSLPRGQGDAAVALGMRKGQTMLYVLLPQAVTVMLPALVSQLVVIVKDTALGGALLGFEELLNQNRQITANYGANTIATLVVIALIYIVLNFALTTFAGRLERRLRQGRKSAAVTLPAQAGAAEAKSKAVSDA